jgi:hypothetical protein
VKSLVNGICPQIGKPAVAETLPHEQFLFCKQPQSERAATPKSLKQLSPDKKMTNG